MRPRASGREVPMTVFRVPLSSKPGSFQVALVAAATVLTAQAPPPRDWIDPDTGHHIVRLTDDGGGSTLYFHDNAFSAQGDKLMFNTPSGIAVVDVAKIGTGAAKAEI